jgi:hypothetical protein
MILLPLACLLVWSVALHRHDRSLGAAALLAGVLLGAFASLLTELQSAAGLLTPWVSAVGWTGLLAVGAVLARHGAADRPPAPTITRTALFRTAPIMLLTAPVLITALAAAPNSYDGLTYHLPRVERWLQQGSLAPFATPNTRQLFMPSWPEYAILQTYLLGDGDRHANLVQWLAWLGAIAGSALLAGALSSRPSARVLAAGLVATLPMAVSQASGTQTDLIAGCWAVVACAFGHRLLEREDRWDLAGTALALGLAAASKQTAVLFAGLGLLPVVVELLRRRAVSALLQLGVAAAAAVLLLAGPQVARNVAVFGSASGDPLIVRPATTARVAAAPTVVGLLKNVSAQFGTPSDSLNMAIGRGVLRASSWLGVDVHDRRYTWSPRFSLIPWSTHEESAPNPLHVLLLLGCAIAGLVRWRGTRAAWLGCALAAGLVVLSATVKWQDYGGRLFVPFFCIAAAAAAGPLSALRAPLQAGLLVVLTAVALPNALFNYTRPLLPMAGNPITPRASVLAADRVETYFQYHPPGLAPAFIDVALRIAESGCRDVALRSGADAWEQPIRAITRLAGGEVRFRSIDVRNVTARYADAAADPCLLVQIGGGARTPPDDPAAWEPLVLHESVAQPQLSLALFRPRRPPA